MHSQSATGVVFDSIVALGGAVRAILMPSIQGGAAAMRGEESVAEVSDSDVFEVAPGSPCRRPSCFVSPARLPILGVLP